MNSTARRDHYIHLKKVRNGWKNDRGSGQKIGQAKEYYTIEELQAVGMKECLHYPCDRKGCKTCNQ